MSSTTTIEVQTAALVQQAVVTSLTQIFQPFLAQQHAVVENEGIIMGLRGQLHANLELLVPVLAPSLRNVQPLGIQIVTVEEVPGKIKAVAYAGPPGMPAVCWAEDAATTSGALKNLLKYTEHLLASHVANNPPFKSQIKRSTATRTSSKVGSSKAQLAKHTTPIKFKSAKFAHTREHSAVNAWDSSILKNPSFNSFESDATTPDSGYGTPGPRSAVAGDTVPSDFVSPPPSYLKIKVPAQVPAPAPAPVQAQAPPPYKGKGKGKAPVSPTTPIDSALF